MSFDMPAKIREWQKQLLDTTKRNPLISFKTGKSGGIRIVHPSAQTIWQRLVVDEQPLVIPWMSEILGSSSDEDGDEIHSPSNPSNIVLTDAKNSPEPVSKLDRCIVSPRFREGFVLTDMSDKALRTRLTRLSLNSSEAASERGVPILYIAFGILQWFEVDSSDQAIRSPLILVPVQLERTEGLDSPWRVTPADDEIRFNDPLAERLAADFKLKIHSEPDDPTAFDNPAFRIEHFKKLAALVRNQSRWLVEDEVALGTFSFQKSAMYEDLKANAQSIESSILCKVIAGDPNSTLATTRGLPSERELDEAARPEATFQILDADSSQQAAILAAVQGSHLVVDGPPGTGKSQTIANIIAELMAAGKSVLFVAEKTAALEVVKRRLDNRKIGEFCLELHSHKANKKVVLAELQRSLQRVPESWHNSVQELTQLDALRRSLNSYVKELHEKRLALNTSLFDVHGELATLDHVGARLRHNDSRVRQRDAQYLDSVCGLLNRLRHCESVLKTIETHPWCGCIASTYTQALRDDAEYHCGQLAKLCPRLVDSAGALAKVGFCSDSPSIAELHNAMENAWIALNCDAWWQSDQRQELLDQLETWEQCAKEVRLVREKLKSRFHSKAFKQEAAQLVFDSERFRSWWSRLWPRWWSTRQNLRALWRNAPKNSIRFWDEIGQLRQFHDHWRRAEGLQKGIARMCFVNEDRSASPARTRDFLKRMDSPQVDFRSVLRQVIESAEDNWRREWNESWQFLTSRLFDAQKPIGTGHPLVHSRLIDLQNWLVSISSKTQQLEEWLHFQEMRAEAKQLDVSGVIDELRQSELKLDEVSKAFRARFFRMWQDAVLHDVPDLRRFRTADHEDRIAMFRQLDKRSVESAASRIRERLTRNQPMAIAEPADAPQTSELGILFREIHKKRRHLSLRRLFAKLPTLLPRLKPCLMMSPLSVSTYLNSPDFRFDVVIFDEASQIRPADAIGAIRRGNQLVVAGDQRQLPPTSFFERMLSEADNEADDDDSENLADYESILDVWCSRNAPRRRLRWHYRSRREGLIAFANQFVYDGELITFPSPSDVEGSPAIDFRFVSDGLWEVGAGVNSVEARQVAQLIMTHARETPDQSLGVVAFSQRQQLRILDELELLRRANPELEVFFADDRTEPFFVKNLENVQGDERDVMILSVGYGPDANGKVAMRFGPLNQQGGERRLNVAITRARQHMTVVSSLRASDIDLSRSEAKGVRLLRNYLDFAENGKKALGSAISSVNQRDFDSQFEREVAAELERRGLTLHRQIGCSTYRIDLAVVDPQSPGRYLLGIECDGATYHSAATARDRDRLRQEVLEGLGWRFSRIWSTDWLRDREGQVKRVFDALNRVQNSIPGPTAEVVKSIEHRDAFRAVEELPNFPVAAPEARPITQTEFSSIEDVPANVLKSMIADALRAYGATDLDCLVKEVRERLGFKRTGSLIKDRIEIEVLRMQQKGEIDSLATDGRLRLANP